MNGYWMRNNFLNFSPKHFGGTLGSWQYLFLGALVSEIPSSVDSDHVVHEMPATPLHFTFSQLPNSIQFSTPILNAASVKCSQVLQPKPLFPPLMYLGTFYIFVR